MDGWLCDDLPWMLDALPSSRVSTKHHGRHCPADMGLGEGGMAVDIFQPMKATAHLWRFAEQGLDKAWRPQGPPARHAGVHILQEVVCVP